MFDYQYNTAQLLSDQRDIKVIIISENKNEGYLRPLHSELWIASGAYFYKYYYICVRFAGPVA